MTWDCPWQHLTTLSFPTSPLRLSSFPQSHHLSHLPSHLPHSFILYSHTHVHALTQSPFSPFPPHPPTPLTHSHTHSLTSADIELPRDLGTLSSQDSSQRTRHEVWRRYSEFEALRHFLCTVYPYVSEIPSAIQFILLVHQARPSLTLWKCDFCGG